MAGVSPRDTEAELLESIKGIFMGNDLTRVGSGYHSIIEQAAEVADSGLITNTDGIQIFFTDEQARPAIELKQRHPFMIHEVSATKIYDTRYGQVQIKGKVDGVDGRLIQDTKCKFRPPNLYEYYDSYQWRYYLDMLGLQEFRYDLFEFVGFKALTGNQPHLLQGVSVRDAVSLPVGWYPNMAGDCLVLLNDFLDYIELRQLWPFLKQVTDPTIQIS